MGYDGGGALSSNEDLDSEEPNAAQNPEEGKSCENEEEKEKKESGSQSSEHDGKYFVIPKGKAMCDKGTTFPNFKVTSHQKHYWNDAEGQADYLAVTEDDLTFNPPAAPFGSCSVKNGNPCTFAPAGKWQKPYKKVKVMGKSCLTEASELMCIIGGKITVLKHGQQSEAGKSNVKKASAKEQHVYNPLVYFEEFQEEINGNEAEVW
ncbi:DUF4280 domain-containing protein [Kaistella carnis]|uniref:DUF4280 domain-containing protein n=2 Tax=Kaistella carnis TaxID=1241979 RepID=A0A3G8XPG9_9FLAO|nr:DUF4280 domain-containing protein [Kaistella carnis]